MCFGFLQIKKTGIGLFKYFSETFKYIMSFRHRLISNKHQAYFRTKHVMLVLLKGKLKSAMRYCFKLFWSILAQLPINFSKLFSFFMVYKKFISLFLCITYIDKNG